MEFRILGPLEVASEERTESIASAKERALLGLLLIEANRVVSSDRLIDELWDGNPPDSASTSIRVLVSRLRKTLASFDDRELIATRAPGYVLQVGDGELDSVRFDALTARGRTLLVHGDAAGAARSLRDALALWRGPPLADVDDLSTVATVKIRLEESRLAALEDRVDADLAAGQHAPLTAELETLTRLHPLRERLWAQRMIALYRAGRQADALRVYQELRRVLGDELGIEPSPDVVRLETAIVRQEESLAWQPPAGSVPIAAAAAGGALPSGVVTLLLTDIEGSTPLWEAKPTAMADALTRHDDLMRTIVRAHGGTLLRARGEGDSTFSVFARATDAAEAALEAQDAISREPWPDGIELRVRMALHTGETVERDGDYYGTAVNRAARLRSVAEPATIIVSQSTAELIVDHLTGAQLVELGEQSLRGLSRPERVYALRPLADAPATPAAPAAEHPVDLPASISRTVAGVFVGRDAELARLTSAWDAACAGQPQLVLIAGEAGIGKTRLAAQFATIVHAGGAVVLFGRCDEDGGEPYQPFAEALRSLVAAAPGVAVAAGPHLARLIPDTAQSLGLPPAPSLGEADAERRALFEAVPRAIGSLLRPVAVLIDDLHWAAGPTLLMLRHLLRSDDATRVMVVCTYRDTDIDRAHPLSSALADLRRETNVTRIALPGLDKDGVVAYVEATAGQQLEEHERTLATEVYAKTEGNPFFVVEVLRHLVETGAVYRSAGRWHTDVASVEAAGLPEGVRDVITRRLDRLPELANRLLAAAAVTGPDFSLAVLDQVVAGESEDLLEALEQSVRSGLINENAPGQYAFTHALIRQTLYSELTSTRRARLHRRIGEAIESLPNAGAHIDALAHHFAEAALDGQVAKAARYALAAGHRAIERSASEAAAGHFERGLELIELDEDAAGDQRGELRHGLAVARWSQGDRAGARDAALTATGDARRASNPALLGRIAIVLAGLTEIGAPDPTVEGVCHEALDALPDSDFTARARVLAALARYRSYGAGDGAGAAEVAAEAVALARAAGDAATIMSTMNAQLLALQGLGRTREQLALAEEVIDLAERQGNERARAEGMVARSQAHHELGDRPRLGRDLADLDELGHAQRWSLPAALALAMRASLANCEGAFAESERFESEVHRRAHGSFDATTAALAVFGVRSILRGAMVGALDAGLLLVEQSPGLGPAVALLERLGRIIDPELGGDSNLALTVADVTGIRHDSLRPLSMCLATEIAAHRRQREVVGSLAPAISEYAGMLIPVGRGGPTFGAADRFLGMLAALDARWDDACAHFEAALALEEQFGARVFVAHTKYWYGRTLLEHGQPDDRARALRLLTDALEAAVELDLPGVARNATEILFTCA